MTMSEVQSLKDKTAKGMLWGGVSNGLQQLLNLLFGIVLARLLTPADYGMVGVLAIFSLIASTLQESGFTAALANKRDASHQDFNAVFWFSTLTGITLYALLFACAPLIARFFGEPALTPLARYSFLTFLVSSTGVAHNAWLFRHLKVRQNALINLAALTLSGTVGIGMALHGMAYWGLATQSLAYVACGTALRWWLSGWMPSWRFSLQPLRGMLGFSLRLLATNIFLHINHNLLTIILGRCYSKADVGHFNQGNKWNYMGYSTLQGMVQGVAQPVLREVGDDAGRQLRVLRKMTRFTAFASFPALIGLSLVAPELISLALTPKWAESAQVMQVLCLGSAFLPLQNLYSNLVISHARTDLYMRSVMAQGAVQIAVAVCCYRWGMMAMVTCYAAVNALWTVVWFLIARRRIALKVRHALADIVPFALAAAAAAVAAALTASFVGECLTGTSLASGSPAAGSLSGGSLWATMAVKAAVCATLYVGVMWACGSATLKETIAYLTPKKLRI